MPNVGQDAPEGGPRQSDKQGEARNEIASRGYGQRQYSSANTAGRVVVPEPRIDFKISHGEATCQDVYLEAI